MSTPVRVLVSVLVGLVTGLVIGAATAWGFSDGQWEAYAIGWAGIGVFIGVGGTWKQTEPAKDASSYPGSRGRRT